LQVPVETLCGPWQRSEQPSYLAITLAKCLKEMLTTPDRRATYLIIGGLDGSPNASGFPSHREGVLELLKGLVGLPISIWTARDAHMKIGSSYVRHEPSRNRYPTCRRTFGMSVKYPFMTKVDKRKTLQTTLWRVRRLAVRANCWRCFPIFRLGTSPLCSRGKVRRSVAVQSVVGQLSTSSSQWRSEQQRPEFALSPRSCELLDGWTNPRQMVG
jgi:hypothetical protein